MRYLTQLQQFHPQTGFQSVTVSGGGRSDICRKTIFFFFGGGVFLSFKKEGDGSTFPQHKHSTVDMMVKVACFEERKKNKWFRHKFDDKK